MCRVCWHKPRHPAYIFSKCTVHTVILTQQRRPVQRFPGQTRNHMKTKHGYQLTLWYTYQYESTNRIPNSLLHRHRNTHSLLVSYRDGYMQHFEKNSEHDIEVLSLRGLKRQFWWQLETNLRSSAYPLFRQVHIQPPFHVHLLLLENHLEFWQLLSCIFKLLLCSSQKGAQEIRQN